MNEPVKLEEQFENKTEQELACRLGRLMVPDARDAGFKMSSLLAPKPPSEKRYKYWHHQFYWGDQGEKPHCVAYAWAHYLTAGNITQKAARKEAGEGKAPFDTSLVYSEAQKVDQWYGESYDGTSVRAGAKILQRMGYVTDYFWAWDIHTAIQALLTKGPLVVGTNWYYGMFFPDSAGLIKVEGQNLGGHAYLVDGVNLDRGIVRIKNSWGRGWGKNGFAYMSLADFEVLIRQQGEVCLAVEVDRQ